MNRATRFWLTVGLMSAIAPAILSQERPNQPSPLPPSSDAIGPQLIAWSELQKPQPVQPQPEPAQRSDPEAVRVTSPSTKPPQAGESRLVPQNTSKP
ncbi:MAG: hypothetical protein WB523_16120 [Candidatus Sulfotelmatobacter sp.]